MRKPFKAAPPKPLPKIYVKPAVAGQGPRDDVTHIKLPDEGAWVEDNSWWNRRLLHKDCVRATPPGAQPKAKPAPAKTKPTPKKLSSEE